MKFSIPIAACLALLAAVLLILPPAQARALSFDLAGSADLQEAAPSFDLLGDAPAVSESLTLTATKAPPKPATEFALLPAAPPESEPETAPIQYVAALNTRGACADGSCAFGLAGGPVATAGAGVVRAGGTVLRAGGNFLLGEGRARRVERRQNRRARRRAAVGRLFGRCR